ncbi:hypothetical protein EC973_007971 [Apophysomyces ossiformis]|uniref:SH3 domain-containing protein n=1 Tax=Apophysomyces ossiformis TaxID=679940 RepID=A0A8H7BT61_9FUNG|nr:hypothetical protein EC973_007971 [Apophysomyces ossiformis]
MDLYRAHHDYQAQQEDELTLKNGDIVRVQNLENPDWWLAEKQETLESGMVPSNFLEPVGAAVPLEAPNAALETGGPILARVLDDYEAQTSEELSLRRDNIVTILDQSVGDNKWKGDLNGKIGVFPTEYVKIIEANEESGSAAEEVDPRSRHGFKLAAYGVKQGGIGSILAGGFPLRKKTVRRTSIAEGEKRAEDHTVRWKHTLVPTYLTRDQPMASSQTNEKREKYVNEGKALVLHDYEPVKEDEIRLMRGEYVTISDRLDDQGWWQGVNEKGDVGLFPSNFVQVLDEQQPPARPPRARPPTIKPEMPASGNEPLVSPTLARPPPVPVATRPSSLLTNRTSAASEPAPLNGPPAPPRPVTSPPLASRTTVSPETRRHKPRVPSVHAVPVVSPDLPPVTGQLDHSEHPLRPSRPVPAPASTVSTNSVNSDAGSSKKVDPHKPMIPLAKPPKVKPFAGPSGPSVSQPLARASADSDTPVAPERKSFADPPLSPPIPKRAMPRPPPLAAAPNEESTVDGVSGEDLKSNEPILTPKHSRQPSASLNTQAPPIPSRSPPLASSARSSDSAVDNSKMAPPPRPSIPPPASPASSVDSAVDASKMAPPRPSVPPPDALEAKIRHIVRKETEKIRQEFELLLEEERKERLRLENELLELKKHL